MIPEKLKLKFMIVVLRFICYQTCGSQPFTQADALISELEAAAVEK